MTRPLGLPDNAWKNCKSYMASSFPSDALEGDRIWRTDQPIGNRWYTYMLLNGIGWWVPDYITGRTTLTVVNNSVGNAAVTFPVEFPTLPVVTLSFGHGSELPPRWLLYAQGVSTTGFTIGAYNTQSTFATFNIFVQWVAHPRL